MDSKPRRPWYSFRLSGVLYWFLVLLLIVTVADIVSAFMSAMAERR